MGSVVQSWTFLHGAFTNPRHDTEFSLSAGPYRFEATGRASLERGTRTGSRPGMLTGDAVVTHRWDEFAAVNGGHVEFVVDQPGRYRVQPKEPGTVSVSAI